MTEFVVGGGEQVSGAKAPSVACLLPGLKPGPISETKARTTATAGSLREWKKKGKSNGPGLKPLLFRFPLGA